MASPGPSSPSPTSTPTTSPPARPSSRSSAAPATQPSRTTIKTPPITPASAPTPKSWRFPSGPPVILQRRKGRRPQGLTRGQAARATCPRSAGRSAAGLSKPALHCRHIGNVNKAVSVQIVAGVVVRVSPHSAEALRGHPVYIGYIDKCVVVEIRWPSVDCFVICDRSNRACQENISHYVLFGEIPV